MSTVERIFRLIERNGINAAKLLRETSLHSTTLTKWKKGNYSPPASTVLKIAEYFGVSVDYLLRGSESENSDFLENSILVIPPVLQEFYKDIREDGGVFSQEDIDEIADLISFVKFKSEKKNNRGNLSQLDIRQIVDFINFVKLKSERRNQGGKI